MARLTLAALVAALSASLVAAVPVVVVPRATTAADIIAQIMPASVSCAGAATATTGCATNVQAAPYLINALASYGLTHPAEIAGVLALTGYESGDLRYRQNLVTAGQGTSNMQSLAYNKLYAASFPALSAGLAAAGDDADAVLALVTTDEYNFGSGAWFLATQCTADTRTQLQAGDDAGFAAYMACVGVSATDARLAYWRKAQAAFGLA